MCICACSMQESVYMDANRCVYISVYYTVHIYLAVCLCVYLSIFLSIHLSIYYNLISTIVYLSIYVSSIHLYTYNVQSYMCTCNIMLLISSDHQTNRRQHIGLSITTCVFTIGSTDTEFENKHPEVPTPHSPHPKLPIKSNKLPTWVGVPLK